MEIQNKEDPLAVFFLDSVGEDQNKRFQHVYHELFNQGDFIEKYEHILDCLNIVHSHHCVGLQLVDFICGAFSGYLMGFPDSKELCKKRVLPLLRKYGSRTLGYGLIEVPKNATVRSGLDAKLKS